MNIKVVFLTGLLSFGCIVMSQPVSAFATDRDAFVLDNDDLDETDRTLRLAGLTEVAAAHVRRGEFDKALDLQHQALACAPEDKALILSNVAAIHASAGEFELAYLALGGALHTEADFLLAQKNLVSVLFQWAEYYAETNRSAEALEMIERVLQNDPEFAPALELRRTLQNKS